MLYRNLFSFLSLRHFIWWAILLTYIIISFYASYAWLPELPKRYQVTSAYLISTKVGTPEALKHALKKPVTLPDWNTADTLNTISLWYQIPLERTIEGPQKQAVYLPKVSQNAQVYLNGKWLGNGGNMTPPITRNRNNTLLFNFDSTLLRHENTLSIHVVGQHDTRTYLGEVYIGPVEPLRAHAEFNNHLRIDLSTLITLCMLLTSILVSVLWILRRTDTYYLCYGLFSALWAFHDSNHFVRNIPMPLNLWETLMPLSFGLAMLGIALFLHRYVGIVNQKAERFLIVTVGLLAIPFLYQDLDWILFYAYHIWSPIIALSGFYSLYYLYRAYQQTKEDRLVLLFISGCSIMIFGTNDLLLAVEHIPKQSPYMMHFAVLFTVLTIIITLINRFIQSINV
ncbi:MAG: 7TM diverse intracellular signaling domain-containing protein, partial [Leucothrix sp.]